MAVHRQMLIAPQLSAGSVSQEESRMRSQQQQQQRRKFYGKLEKQTHMSIVAVLISSKSHYRSLSLPKCKRIVFSSPLDCTRTHSQSAPPPLTLRLIRTSLNGHLSHIQTPARTTNRRRAKLWPFNSPARHTGREWVIRKVHVYCSAAGSTTLPF